VLCTSWLHDKKDVQYVKNPCHLSTKVLFWNKWTKKTAEELAHFIHISVMAVDFVRDNLGEPVPEETFYPLTPIMVISHPYLLPPSITIHGILPVQFT